MLSLAILPIFSMALAFQTQSISPEAIAHAKAGIAAQKAGQLKTAIAEFKKVTELAPDFPAAFVNLGAAYLQDHDYTAAIPPLKHSLELNANLIGAEQMLGYALLADGYAAESIPHLERAHVQDALGIAQLKTGKYPEAIANLNAALAKRPNDPELLYYLGRASGLLSKEAMDTLEADYPNSPRSHQALAENYAALRQVPQGEKEYREALHLNPSTPGVHLEFGQLYAAASDWPKAEIEFRAEAALQPGDAETAYSLGNALLQQGKLPEAQAALERADQLRPAMPPTLFALAKTNSLEGRTAEAETAWKKQLAAEASGPLAAQAHFALATLYRKQGKSAEAAREMQAYQQLHTAAK
jgi:tetratricopeptide (TPR) repeat protein